MKLETRSHSDPASPPARHFVDGRAVTANDYWDTFDDNYSTERGMSYSMVDRDEPHSQRSRHTVMTLN